jgi:hypothetical protein
MKQHLILQLPGKECNMERSYSLNEFARRNAIGLTTVRGEIKAGRLAARKIGRRTIIAAEDAKAWRERLPKVPAASPTPGRPKRTSEAPAL